MKSFGGIALLALLLLSCDKASPASLVADTDPFLYNGSAAFRVPVYALDTSGKRVESPLTAASSQPQVAEVTGDVLRCLRAGDADITASLGSLRTSFRLECRPIASFRPPLQAHDLVLGDSPVPISVNPVDSAGQSVRALRFSAHTEDTAVVAIVGGTVVARGLGAASILLDFGGVSTTIAVEVVAAEYRDTIDVAAGEYRSWTLGPGRYIAKFSALDAAGTQLPLVWRSRNANCAFEISTRAHMHCGLKEPGAVVLFAAQPARAAVRIDRRAP